MSVDDLARLFLRVQGDGCNILNLVSQTHYIPVITEGLAIAAADGFNIPVVYNCGGYELPGVLKLLEGIVDIYMPDMKTLDSVWAENHLYATDYPNVATEALHLMFKQVGNLVITPQGMATNGLLIRHLVMPGQTNDCYRITDLIHAICGSEAYLNIMDQYRPCFQAYKYDELARRITPTEWRDAVNYVRQRGLIRGLES